MRRSEIEWALRRYYAGDASPCPPPKMKRVTPTADEFKIVAPLEQEMAKLRAGLAEQTIVIRCLVDLCMRRGVFNGEELQALVQEARRRQ